MCSVFVACQTEMGARCGLGLGFFSLRSGSKPMRKVTDRISRSGGVRVNSSRR